MDRKCGKYVVNVEHSENPPPRTCPNDQEAHNSARWRPPSNDIATDVCSNLPGTWVSPGLCEHSGCSHPELSSMQIKESCCNDWSLWKVFLTCLLACVITTAIGVLILSLVKSNGNNPSIVIQLPNNSGQTTVTSGTASTTSQSTTTTASTEPTTTVTATTVTSADSTASTASTQSTSTATTSATSSDTSAITTSTSVTTSASTQTSTTAPTTVTSADSTASTASTQSTTASPTSSDTTSATTT
ncbi:dynactin-associated protein-like [Ochotona princeps]|uniref:dynactin-associated protein-like n=1 Tax=Ochotona princeps TaxID=9978 RepID=UPI002714EB33|nr:dynactin-associated protein-like [Ochotona princeps]